MIKLLPLKLCNAYFQPACTQYRQWVDQALFNTGGSWVEQTRNAYGFAMHTSNQHSEGNLNWLINH